MSLCLLRGGLERVAAVLLTNVPMSCKSIEQKQQQRGSFDVTMNVFCSELQCSQRCQLSRGISFPFTLVFVSSYIYLPPAILLCSPPPPGRPENFRNQPPFTNILDLKYSFSPFLGAKICFLKLIWEPPNINLGAMGYQFLPQHCQCAFSFAKCVWSSMCTRRMVQFTVLTWC